jgi:hypothetical protein
LCVMQVCLHKKTPGLYPEYLFVRLLVFSELGTPN